MEKDYKTENYIKKGIKYNPKADYCSSFCEGLFGVYHNYACYLHDRQYRKEVTKRLTRKEADEEFRKNVLMIYKLNRKPIIGYILSTIMYIGVRIFSGRHWDK